jgi:hypothetical protein
MNNDASDFPPSNDYLQIGNHREPWPIPATPQGHCLLLDRGNGQFVIVTGGDWFPAEPHHPDFYESWRLQALWLRVARWVGLTDLQLLEKFDRRDLADCHAEVVVYHPTLASHRECTLALPLVSPHGRFTPYHPPFYSDHLRWTPRGPDRLDAARRPEFEARLVAAKMTVEIGEFFRPTDQLGAGNDEAAALAEFNPLFVSRKAVLDHLAQPVPHLPKNWRQDFPPSSGGDSIGGRGFPH